MKSRHYSEVALEAALRAHNIKDVQRSIKSVLDAGNKASLRSVNKDGQTFLQIALQAEFNKGFLHLLGYYQDDDEFIFRLDNNQRTICHYAANHGSLETNQYLFNGKFLHPNWKFLCKNGFSIIHNAATNQNNVVLLFILEQLQQHPDAKEIINYYNHNSRNALYFAKQINSIKNIAHLINFGADIETIFDGRQTFIHAVKHNESYVLQLFNLLDDKHKNVFFEAWRRILLENLEDNRIRDIYYKLASKISLKTLTQAHLEFNPGVTVHAGISDNILFSELIPDAYRQKVQLTEALLFKLLRVKAENKHNPNIKTSDQSNWRLRLKDEESLKKLIQQVDHRISALKQKGVKHNNYLKYASYAIMTIGLLAIFSTPLISLIPMTYILFDVIFFSLILGGSLVTMGGFSLRQKCDSINIKIRKPDDTDGLFSNTNTNIISSLQNRKNNHLPSPVSSNNTDKLESSHKDLVEDKERSIVETIGLFQSLKSALISVLSDLQHSNIPISIAQIPDKNVPKKSSQDKEEVIINMAESTLMTEQAAATSHVGFFAKPDSDSDDETVSLLDNEERFAVSS